MQTLNMHQAKTHFSKWIEAVTEGEKFIIARSGRPVGMLVPLQRQPHVRHPGALKGQIKTTSDFDAPLPEPVRAAFGCK